MRWSRWRRFHQRRVLGRMQEKGGCCEIHGHGFFAVQLQKAWACCAGVHVPLFHATSTHLMTAATETTTYAPHHTLTTTLKASTISTARPYPLSLPP
jgi:hypothetical protein